MIMGKVSESIFSGETMVIPMAEVLFIEKHYETCDLVNGAKKGDLRGISIIQKGTKWSQEMDTWGNNAYLSRKEAGMFLRAWCDYRAELEAETLMSVSEMTSPSTDSLSGMGCRERRMG